MTYARNPHIQARLDAWALWLHSYRGGGGGHPLARLMDLANGKRVGLSDSASYGARVPINDLECELTNRAVCALPADLRAAVAAWHDRSDGQTRDHIAARLGIVRGTLHRRLCQADLRLAEWLHAHQDRGAGRCASSITETV